MKNEQFSGIWIFAEHENGAVKPVVFELLAKAQELKAHNGENITAVLLGANVAGLAPELIARGADEVIVAEDEVSYPAVLLFHIHCKETPDPVLTDCHPGYHSCR